MNKLQLTRVLGNKVFVRSVPNSQGFSRVRVGISVSGILNKSYVKQSTGIVGLAVEPNAKPILINLYNDLLETLQPMPPTFEYRVAIENLLRSRLEILNKENDIEEIEKKISFGQVEELIEQAKEEKKNLENLIEAKAWEVDENDTVTVIDAPTLRQKVLRETAAKNKPLPK